MRYLSYEHPTDRSTPPAHCSASHRLADGGEGPAGGGDGLVEASELQALVSCSALCNALCSALCNAYALCNAPCSELQVLSFPESQATTDYLLLTTDCLLLTTYY